jgi:hypothetical protein
VPSYGHHPSPAQVSAVVIQTGAGTRSLSIYYQGTPLLHSMVNFPSACHKGWMVKQEIGGGGRTLSKPNWKEATSIACTVQKATIKLLYRLPWIK